MHRGPPERLPGLALAEPAGIGARRGFPAWVSSPQGPLQPEMA